MSVNQLDIDALNSYLSRSANSIGEVTDYKKFSGGQSNPTFLLTTASGNVVLRRQPPGKLLKSAHAVDREYRVIEALQDTRVPVPAVHHFCRDTEVLGSMFYIMEYVSGDIFWDAALKDIPDNQTRAHMYDNMNQVLADLHDVDITAVGLDDFGKPGNYFARQVERWTQQYRASETTPQPEMENLIDYLKQNLPEDDGQISLVHGDFRLDNMMFSDQRAINAVLDWELSTLGHPYADLAYQCMQLRLPANLPQAPGLGGLDRAALGIPSEQDYVAKYCDRRNLAEIDRWPFYLAFSFFRLAAIIQGVVKRAQEGNASSDKARELGSMVAPLAGMALKIIRKE
ncbi:phosphotransferase family protein [Salinimonas sp. HHU 13199]|uniref:Phosphotransferase family protein n=1 Tax=Salinimonas profundi TaxID=2729140 RepID=A0ABR8LG19_9ALTE|nr:phosphotransferase family protein [Salinimonas profundi]MBD3584250.1 phosphotransferase family protein [Salinimonas profundi]